MAKYLLTRQTVIIAGGEPELLWHGAVQHAKREGGVYARPYTLNATMYREAGVRRGIHFNPECPHSVLPTVERGLKSEPKNKSTSTHCMLEN